MEGIGVIYLEFSTFENFNLIRQRSSCFLGDFYLNLLAEHGLWSALTVYVFMPQVMSWYKGIPQQNSEI
jgi:hypothetical protein